MQTPNPKTISLTGKVWCSFFGHHYVTSRNVTNHFREYQCSVCRRELTNDENGHIVSLTPKHRHINDTLSLFYQKRHPIV